jgi:hypothetical protein
LFSIASDLSDNPLHEAPTCRIDPITLDGECRILLFDGQHKALATWLRGEKTIAFKIYLNLTRQQATTLVNSIQSKIKKLPLTPFELASKLSDEYSDRLGHYEAGAGEDNVSEEGFVEWLPASDRKNAKKEIEAAILKEIADDPTFLFPKIVEMRGRKVSEPWKITETNFHNKFLKELAYTQPLPASYFKGSAMQAARIKERENIITILNLLFDKVYGSLDVNSSEQEKERAKRMSYQSALRYIAHLIKKIVNIRLVPTDEEYAFVEKTPTQEQIEQISKAIERLISHSVWTAAYDSSDKMKAVQDALTKNQNIEVAMNAVGLTPGYCLGL